MKIVLCGYMGCGKSTVGQLLSEKLNVDFLEIDTEIEKKENSSITDIFQENGEIYFRKIENIVLNEVLKTSKNEVISLGGGTPCYANNLHLLKSNEHVKLFYLKMTPQNLTARLINEKQKRPLINHLQTEEKLEEYIRKHLFERQFYYLQSDFMIDANAKSVEELTEEIINLLQ
ncbi:MULTISPECIES: shikimate kinase [Mesonia]|mgnify:FL=1|uniref:Shikimate kinase n=1 Tax=Mesonia oceanica TaxID=2687242 RepID=A0AC61Y6B0_9FLAO|nr:MULTISPECIES: shikimate kinase [Mesonia]MAN26315.1 shikimate kinase [Mesonia sp.]MAQ42257.1 shikimate kinase [Mesonia sp.]MBJ98543.1 shikimate kinase [Flavobacteriaceae bacterium]VVV00042.1 Shikimate kinase [Mesonia oceanica]|tara:strand:+ start:295 stop:816 length:522 start_codon:yes stop_codon:yes gene_type:complete